MSTWEVLKDFEGGHVGLTILITWLIFAVIVALAASGRGRNAIAWFLIAVLISPLLALIAVLVMPSVGNRAAPASPIFYAPPTAPVEPRKPCPECGEQVPLIARICRFCRYEFKDMPPRMPAERPEG